MAQYVMNASLVPSFLDRPNQGTVGVLVMKMGFCRTASTSLPKRLDPRAHIAVRHVPGMHITDHLGVACETHSGEQTAIETSTLTLYGLHHSVHHSVWWQVAMVNSKT